MENSALNKAHQQHRLADKHLRCRRYAEAIACHKNAVDLLSDALKCTENPRSLESIKLQIDFHGRQRNIINIMKEQHEKYKLALEHKLNNYNALIDCSSDGNVLTDAIYQTIEETDSLIDLIQQKHAENDSVNQNTDTVDGPVETGNVTAVKHPKDDKTVIEEFKILNKQLHLLVSQLVNQLDNSRKENEMLKNKLKQYEFEKVQNNQNQLSNLKVTSDSSGGTSPYVFSPCSDFSSDVQESNSLPLLAIPNVNYPQSSTQKVVTHNSKTKHAEDS